MIMVLATTRNVYAALRTPKADASMAQTMLVVKAQQAPWVDLFTWSKTDLSSNKPAQLQKPSQPPFLPLSNMMLLVQ